MELDVAPPGNDIPLKWTPTLSTTEREWSSPDWLFELIHLNQCPETSSTVQDICRRNSPVAPSLVFYCSVFTDILLVISFRPIVLFPISERIIETQSLDMRRHTLAVFDCASQLLIQISPLCKP